MSRLIGVTLLLGSAVLASQPGPEPPLPTPLPGARLIDTTAIDEPLELKPATADEEAIIAGQRHVRYTYERLSGITAVVFVQTFRDALFASGWKLLDAPTLDVIPIRPETVTVAAQYREHDRNLYARYRQEPGKPYTVSVADVGAEDWAVQLAATCRIRIHSIHFEHDRAAIKPHESAPTLRKLADVLTSKAVPPVVIEGHMDNIGETGAEARDLLAAARARAVASWLTLQGGVPAARLTARGMGKAHPIADNDSDLGRALNRRIEVARQDCPR